MAQKSQMATSTDNFSLNFAASELEQPQRNVTEQDSEHEFGNA